MKKIQNNFTMPLCDFDTVNNFTCWLRFSKDTGKCFFSTWIDSTLSACPLIPFESIPMSEIAESKERGI